jgi:ribosomal protein S27E
MQSEAGPKDSQPGESRDLLFQCQQCGAALIVDRLAAGMTVRCQNCGKPTPVPQSDPAPPEPKKGAETDKLAELQRHLKENDSQRTEVQGYINQLNIQLHRWKLRLQSLEERKVALTAEISQLKAS